MEVANNKVNFWYSFPFDNHISEKKISIILINVILEISDKNRFKPALINDTNYKIHKLTLQGIQNIQNLFEVLLG